MLFARAFITINCTEVMKAVNYYDNLLHTYSYIPVGQSGRCDFARLSRISFLKYEVLEMK
jgi:hypothetical protein